MKCYLITGEIPWKTPFEDKPHLKKLEEVLLEFFKDYEPKPGNIPGAYNYPVFELSVPSDHEPFRKLLNEFSKIAKESEPPCAIVLREFPTTAEVPRARFILPGFFTREVDEAPRFELLNPTMVLCQYCRFPNLKSVPEPFLVNKVVLKRYDLFRTTVGLLVVRPRVLDLLRKAIGDQFDFGNAMMAKSKSRPTGQDRLFWIRPKETIGARMRFLREDWTCSECKRERAGWYGSTNDIVTMSGPGLVDERIRVSHFGSGTADIALVDNSASASFPTLVMSGALMTHLEASGVKGFVPHKKYPVDCVFSAKGEATLHPQTRTFGVRAVVAKPTAMDETTRTAARELTASLKRLPWDCSKDGHIYFHLSTSSFVLLDPMTGEEDDEGPYAVKNFKGPGVYRLPVKAIRHGRKRGVAVDSGTLVFVDNAFFPEFVERYSWDESHGGRGEFDLAYHQRIAEAVGTRFGICSPPPRKFKSDFEGDGYYTIDVKAITQT